MIFSGLCVLAVQISSLKHRRSQSDATFSSHPNELRVKNCWIPSQFRFSVRARHVLRDQSHVTDIVLWRRLEVIDILNYFRAILPVPERVTALAVRISGLAHDVACFFEVHLADALAVALEFDVFA